MATQQPPPTEAFVSFSAEINPHTTESLIATMSNLANQGIPRVTLCLSTPGGGVTKGLTIYNTLRALPFTLVTHNVGSVNSIGNAVFLAGEERYASPHSTFMFHGVSFTANAGEQLDHRRLRERMDGLLADEKRIGSILDERTKLTTTKIQPLFVEEQTKDAAYAVSVGIVDEIRDLQIPPGIPIISLVFQR